MAVSLEMNKPQRVTLSPLAGNMTRADLPTGCQYLRIRFVAAEGFVLTEGTDGAAKGTDFETEAADTTVVRACDSLSFVLVAGSASGQVVELTALFGGV